MPNARKRPPGVRVETSHSTNLLPRQPKLRKSPHKGKAPSKRDEKQPSRLGARKSREQKDSVRGLTKQAAERRAARETISAETIAAAHATGLLPHEWLLAVMRGEQLNHFAYDSDSQEIVEVIVLPTFADRMEAAKAAAPFYATKLQPAKTGAGGPHDPHKRPGVMQIPLADSMQQWMDIAAGSQAKLKREVVK